MRAKNKLVFGVGISDANYVVQPSVNGRRIWCPLYRVWMSMLFRCYSKNEHARHPTYIGCTVVNEWHSFSVFRAWMLTQDWEGKQLDKDILSPGNKVYGPDTCVFVSQEINKFLTDRGACRGTLPIGVSFESGSGKYRGHCSNPFTGKKSEHLGRYNDPNTAHAAWRRRKHQHACAYADQQIDQRIAQALRERFA